MAQFHTFRFYLKSGVGGWLRYLYFRQFTRRYLSRVLPLTILDAGFGHGDYLAWVGEQFPTALVTGYDLAATHTYADNFAITRRKVKTPNVTLCQQDLLDMDDQACFDVVYSIDVLEHIPGNRQVMGNIFRALKPKGLFYLAMPYESGRGTIFPRRLLRHFENWTDEEHIGEMRSLAETEAILKEIGFTILEARYTLSFFARLAWELEQVTSVLPGQVVIARLRRPFLNALAALEFISPLPRVGNLRIICRK